MAEFDNHTIKKIPVENVALPNIPDNELNEIVEMLKAAEAAENLIPDFDPSKYSITCEQSRRLTFFFGENNKYSQKVKRLKHKMFEALVD